MAYGLRYFTQFSDINNANYTVEIWQKDYIGNSNRVTAGAVPVVSLWDKDDPTPPIKGRQLTIQLVNEGWLPLTSFYSEEDDVFEIRFYVSGLLEFKGFLVQDDCNEDLVDYAHYINLSATDNLGLLKDVTLSDAYNTTDLKYKNIFDILKTCLQQTNVSLPLIIHANIKERSQNNTQSFLEQTLVNCLSFATNDNANVFESCYSVLEKIFTRFNLTLIQAYGTWNVIRWAELRYYANFIPNRYYDNFIQQSQGNFSSQMSVGPSTLQPLEIGAYRKIVRPYKYVQETMLYKQPSIVIKNLDLKQLGSLISSTTQGSGTSLIYIDDYNLIGWQNGFTWTTGGSGLLVDTTPYKCIRVLRDWRKKEIDRYIVIQGLSSVDDKSRIASAPMEINVGDSFEISFDVRRKDSLNGAANMVFDLNLVTQMPLAPRGANNRYLDDDGTWDNTITFTYTYTSTDDMANWTTISAVSQPVPFDGNFYIKLGHGPGPANEWYYKNFRINVTYSTDKQGKVKGHTHTTKQDKNIKNTGLETIHIDDTTSNNIAGTLFLNNVVNGLLQQKTANWQRGHLANENRILGDIITFEELFEKRKPRAFIEGSIVGLEGNGTYISGTTIFGVNSFTGLTFVQGRTEIDYRNAIAKVNLYEMWEQGEEDSDLTSDYKFDYILETN